MRTRQSFNKDWYFTLSDHPDANLPHFPHESWQRVTLPHDWSREFPYEKSNPSAHYGGYTKTGTAWYRKKFLISKSSLQNRTLLELDGIFMNAQIWLNGHHLTTRPYGYISFALDLTTHLLEDLNTIAIRVDCQNQPQSRWYNGAGIYRNTWLTETNKTCFAHHGISITTPQVSPNRAIVNYEVTLTNAPKNAEIRASLTFSREPIGERSNVTHVPNSCKTLSAQLEIKNPNLWAPESPNLYQLQIELLQNNTIIDSLTTPFGIRQPAFIPKKGFFLNNNPYKLKGVCLHHDGGVVGAA
ncbi:MAG: hypothetical protein FWD53_06995, partial [Phycisphaerales bacterium]|nr:hypothetical protein [Phycisphaerales bacterium]